MEDEIERVAVDSALTPAFARDCERSASSDTSNAERAASLLVSIVIVNYNYGEFIRCAIDSALGLDWPNVEVIVVDDGSTDDSGAVIREYGDRISAIFQSNAGQRVASNIGFERARGEAIIFLDSDDVLDPSIARELSAVWRPGISKVQFQMRIINASGGWTGAVLPQYGIIPNPARIRCWTLATGGYPTPPGSGNAYARTFLERIFPLHGQDPASDSYCLAAAPWLGDVVTIAKPLVSYRIHGRNDGAMTELSVDRFSRDVERSSWRFKYAQDIAASVGVRLPDTSAHKSLPLLAYRLASLCLTPERHPIEGDSIPLVLRYIYEAAFVPQGITRSARFAFVLWASLVAVAPGRIRNRLVLWRFASTARPMLVRRLLRVFGVVQR